MNIPHFLVTWTWAGFLTFSIFMIAAVVPKPKKPTDTGTRFSGACWIFVSAICGPATWIILAYSAGMARERLTSMGQPERTPTGDEPTCKTHVTVEAIWFLRHLLKTNDMAVSATALDPKDVEKAELLIIALEAHLQALRPVDELAKYHEDTARSIQSRGGITGVVLHARHNDWAKALRKLSCRA